MKITRNLLLMMVLTAVASCRTVEVGTGEIIEESLCDWELHGDSTNKTCWVEQWYQDATGKTRLVLPVSCQVLRACYCQKHECAPVE